MTVNITEFSFARSNFSALLGRVDHRVEFESDFR